MSVVWTIILPGVKRGSCRVCGLEQQIIRDFIIHLPKSRQVLAKPDLAKARAQELLQAEFAAWTPDFTCGECRLATAGGREVGVL